MHQDKIWTMDLYEKIDKVSNDEDDMEEEDEAAYKSTIHLLTGGCDSTIKLWQDHTALQEVEDKEAELKRIQEEQKLSHLIREEDYVEAALLAFKLNKLRDFYHVLNKILSKKDQIEDQVDSVVNDMRRFESIAKNDFTKA